MLTEVSLTGSEVLMASFGYNSFVDLMHKIILIQTVSFYERKVLLTFKGERISLKLFIMGLLSVAMKRNLALISMIRSLTARKISSFGGAQRSWVTL